MLDIAVNTSKWKLFFFRIFILLSTGLYFIDIIQPFRHAHLILLSDSDVADIILQIEPQSFGSDRLLSSLQAISHIIITIPGQAKVNLQFVYAIASFLLFSLNTQ